MKALFKSVVKAQSLIESLLKTPIRINSILFAIMFAALGNNVLVVLVPINLKAANIDISLIGWIMAGYSLGIMLGSIYGNRIISRVGHNRSYASVAALIACTAVLHMFFHGTIATLLLRFLTGISMAVVFITLESWLNATSEKESRGSTFALYQLSYAVGIFLAPLIIIGIDPLDPKSFAVVALFFSLSLIPLSLSRFPTPQMNESEERLGILEMLLDTPSGAVTAIVSGLAISALFIFISIYAIWLGFDQTKIALLIAVASGSAIVFQIPVGQLADKYDERRIIMAISFLALFACLITYLISQFDLDWRFYLVALFFVGGLISCLYPLSVNFIFDQLDSSKAVPAMSTLLILHSFGLILGPILCSTMMSFFGDQALFIYLSLLMAFSALFISYRVYVSRHKPKDEESIPYALTFQMLRPGNFGFDPRTEYLITRVNNPIFETIANSISISPKKTKLLIESSLSVLSGYTPGEVLLALIMYKPRRCEEIIIAMQSLFPNRAIEFTHQLNELIATNKPMINNLLMIGLKHNQDKKTQKQIDQLFEQFITSNQAANQSSDQSDKLLESESENQSDNQPSAVEIKSSQETDHPTTKS